MFDRDVLRIPIRILLLAFAVIGHFVATPISAQTSTLRLWGPEPDMVTISDDFPAGSSVVNLERLLEANSFKTYTKKSDGWYLGGSLVFEPLIARIYKDQWQALCLSNPCDVSISRGFTRPLFSAFSGKHVYHIFWTSENGIIRNITQANSLWLGDK